MNKDKNKKKDLDNKLNTYLEQSEEEETNCEGEECVIKTEKGLVERVNKKIITNDGRQLLM